jgi:hypothetical protein
MSEGPVRRVALVVLLVMLAVSAAAQEPGTLQSVVQPGARVRVSTVGTGMGTGRVVAGPRDSLHVARERSVDTLHLAGSQLTSLDVSVGRHKRRWRGAGLGFLGGAALGAVIGAATYQKPDCAGDAYFCDLGQGFDATFGAALLGGAGAVVGAITGAGRADDWRPVALQRSARLQLIVPRFSSRPAVGASLRF